LENRFTTRLTLLTLLVLGTMIFFALQPFASASEGTARKYVCAARVDCGAPGFPSTQDLPSITTPIVISKNADDAKTKCLAQHSSAYRRLATTIDQITPTNVLAAAHSCKIVSEVFPAGSK
jgi:hypothetical protein